MTRRHARHGTTALLATTMTAPLSLAQVQALHALAPGAWADVVTLDAALRVQAVHAEGEAMAAVG